MRSSMICRAVILGCLFGLLAAGVVLPAPMTHAEALAAMDAWGRDKTADRIVALDTILQATPVVVMPDMACVVAGRDAGVTALGFLTVTVDPYLSYTLTVGPWRFPGVVPARGAWDQVVDWGVGGLVGVLVTTGVLWLSGHLK